MSNYIIVGSKDYKKVIIGIILGCMVNFALMYAPQPLISLFSNQYHISPSTAGLAVSLTSMSVSISFIFISISICALNRQKIMCLSLLLTSCFTILEALTSNFTLFLILRFLQGIAIAGFPAVALTYINEEFLNQDIGRIAGYYVSGSALGGMSGRIIIGSLTDLVNWKFAFLVLGILSLIISLWFIKFFPPSKHFHKVKISLKHISSDIKQVLLNKKLFSIYILGFIFMGSYIIILNYICYPLTSSPYNLSQTVFGFLFFVNLLSPISSNIFAELTYKYPRKRLMSFALSIFLIGTLITMYPNLIIKIVGLSIAVFGFFACHTLASGWVGILANDDQKGTASSYYLFLYYLGASLLGWFGGVFIKHFWWNGIVIFISSLLIIALIISHQPHLKDEA